MYCCKLCAQMQDEIVYAERMLEKARLSGSTPEYLARKAELMLLKSIVSQAALRKGTAAEQATAKRD